MKIKGVMLSIIFVVFFCVGSNVFAVLSGGGTQANPYLIQSQADFEEFANPANAALYWASGNCTMLMCDLDLSGIPYTQAVIAPDASTSSGFQGTQYAGVFDGNNHTLSNLTINQPTKYYVGLFGYVGSGGQIKSLNIENVNINSRSYVGGLVGYNDKGMITACYVSGSVSGTASVGGIVGYSDYGAITACHATGSASGFSSVGGLVGWNNSTVIYCYAGSIVTIMGGENFGIGGLVGDNKGCLVSCYATGSVNWGGGLVGSNDGIITQCYAIGLVQTGYGFVGWQYGYPGEIRACFWDMQTSGKTQGIGGYYSFPGAAGKTTAEMKTLSTFSDAGWDISVTEGIPTSWKMPSEWGYPVLFWQLRPAASSYSGGSGTAGDPYQIATLSDFQNWIFSPLDWSKNLILTENIDLSGLIFTRALIAPDEDSVNAGFQGVAFTGVFDGNDHVISNLTIEASGKDYIGLFGKIEGGQIKNLNIENATLHGHSYVGAIVSLNHRGVVTDCHVTGTVTGTGDFVGGAIGYNSRGTLLDCSSDGTVEGSSSVGGLVGENACGTVTGSSAAGTVTATGTSTYSYAGGLVGWNSSGKIESCFSTADVAATGNDISVGGIVGVLHSGEIASVYAAGTVTGESVSSSYAGGLAGYLSEGSIDTSYSTAAVTATGESGSVGGLVGDIGNGSIATLSCFWDIEASGLAYSAGGKGVTSQLIRTSSVFQNADWAGKDWVMDDGIDTPRLSWQNTAGAAIPLPQAIPFSGSGTKADPYQIYTVEEFASLSWHWGILDKHLKLMNDLDLSGAVLYPIGDLGSFVGVFDGNGHVLRNAVIHQPGSDCVGLFGTLGDGGHIKNLGLVDADIQGNDFVGSLVGKSFAGTISSCYAAGSVTATGWYAGGLAGWNKNATITSSYSLSTVIGTESVGGLVGKNDDAIVSCYARGDIFGTGECVGGLAGENSGTLTACYATGSVIGIDNVGGVVGKHNGTLTGCFWDTTTSNTTDGVGNIDPDPAGVFGKSTSEMKIRSTFTDAGWDFTNEMANGTDDIWRMCADGVDTPRLNWQSTAGDLACPDGVAIEDLDAFTQRWLMTNCTSANNFCGGADLDFSAVVDLADFAIFAARWMEGG